MGRPTDLTDDLQRRLVEAIEAGNYYEAACQRAGVHYSTFLRWMKWGDSGRKDREAYKQFRMAVVAAEGRAEVRIVAQWQQQIPDNWQAARDFLARRFPERWANRDKVDIGGSGKEVVIRVVYGDPGDPAKSTSESPNRDHS